MRFRVGDRVIVTHSDDLDLNGYYGHVDAVHSDMKPYPMVDVAFRGRAGRPAHPYHVGNDPYPMFPYELEHAD